MEKTGHLSIFLAVVTILNELNAVTVSPALCPTNKIAPHRRIGIGGPSQPRTIGLFYDLLAPHKHRPYNDPLNDLQEQPQEDDPNDCGEIEDYDETDLSSLTQQAQRKKDQRHNRLLFGNHNMLTNPSANFPGPSRPQRPTSTRSPFWSGGIFGSNVYRPPLQQRPSNYIKPVQEDTLDGHATYRPEVVGGPLGHVVGFAPVRPSRYPQLDETTQHPFRFQNRPESHRRVPRTKSPNPSTSIVGSFVDLLFN